ncbi:putative quinol monooxygenase [Dyadobacter sp. NIV53]|uniref:putative quinol monooxygenase n=1 Tax=Dyadobacter sp. NIV53 TaxID=2861765 RepID=UPI001C8770CE|nr:antibiotic biosynthesis monooxygenase family protein [Dyadobacter sp. NIV53]
MIIRIVRMTFSPEKTTMFLDIFNQSKNEILGMKGCLYLELWRDLHEQNVFVTHSHWDSEEALNDYRKSEYFGKVWKQTKTLFTEKALAFSVERV